METKAAEQKLWCVSRRAPMDRGDRKVSVWRFIVMAQSESQAIDLARDENGNPEIPEMACYRTGVWSAYEITDGRPVFQLGPYHDEPTETERAARGKGK